MNREPTPRPGNLRPPWKPGESGNPAGYSRDRRRRDRLRRLVEGGATNAELAVALQREGLARDAAETWLRLALTGHWPSFKRLLDLIDGPPPGRRR